MNEKYLKSKRNDDSESREGNVQGKVWTNYVLKKKWRLLIMVNDDDDQDTEICFAKLCNECQKKKKSKKH